MALQQKKFRYRKPRRSLRTILMSWFLVLSLAPLMFVTGYSLVKYEQAIDNDLLTEEDRAAGVYAKFNLNGLMRGAFNDRMTGYSKALGSGGSPAWMTPNEVRALEEINPIDGGDELPKPTNPPVADPASPPAGGN